MDGYKAPTISNDNRYIYLPYTCIIHTRQDTHQYTPLCCGRDIALHQ